MAFDPQGKDRQALVAEIRRLEAVEATLTAIIAARDAAIASLQAANASLTSANLELQAQVADLVTERNALQAAAAAAAPKIAVADAFLVLATKINAAWPPETT
jgi:peptidoglycan hydrolase CwlO-like protein